MEILQKKLKETLTQKKVGQRELARRLNVSQATVWEWLNEGVPSVKRLKEICIALDVSADFLLGLDQEQIL